MSVNRVTLIGRLGKDPEVRATESGKKVANFSLATSESYKDKNTGEKKEVTDWHNIVFWGPTAEVVERFVTKGMQIYIEGKIKTRSYEDKGGNTKSITEVLGQNLTMLGGKSDNQQATLQAPVNANHSDVDDLPF